MTDQIMSNEEYFEQVLKYIEAIESCVKESIKMAADVIGETLFSFDFCFIGLLDRSIHLARGFIPMLRDRNLTCAGALLRLQIDNCLRLFAVYIAEDEKAVVDCIINGDQINKLKDKNGKCMSDGYLKEQLSKYDDRLSAVYNNASGYIHFSSKAFYNSLSKCEDSQLGFQIGCELPEKRNVTLIECAAAYLHYYRFFLRLMSEEAEWKKKYDKATEDQQ